jgi:hypothetical protein
MPCCVIDGVPGHHPRANGGLNLRPPAAILCAGQANVEKGQQDPALFNISLNGSPRSVKLQHRKKITSSKMVQPYQKVVQ